MNRAPTRLIEFSDRLLTELAAGQQISLLLMGSASPRGGSSYNDDLGARRIDCVKNHFLRYTDKIGQRLKPYIDAGKLIFIERNFGENPYDPDSVVQKEKDDQNISADIDDLRNSVYDLVASARRHVRVRLITDKPLQTPSEKEEVTRPTTRDEK